VNERIQELAAEALDKAVPETWTTLDHEQLRRFQEVFAELIVKECIDIVPWQYEKKIRQHFGVE